MPLGHAKFDLNSWSLNLVTGGKLGWFIAAELANWREETLILQLKQDFLSATPHISCSSNNNRAVKDNPWGTVTCCYECSLEISKFISAPVCSALGLTHCYWVVSCSFCNVLNIFQTKEKAWLSLKGIFIFQLHGQTVGCIVSNLCVGLPLPILFLSIMFILFQLDSAKAVCLSWLLLGTEGPYL